MLKKLFFKLGDHVAIKYGNQKVVRKRLEIERKITAKVKGLHEENYFIEYGWTLYPNVHQRCSSLLTHVSIMLTLSVVVLNQTAEGSKSALFASLLSVVFYLFLLILSLRTLRSFGLDNDFINSDGSIDTAKYTEGFLEEIATKFALVELINTLTGAGMIATAFMLVVFHL